MQRKKLPATVISGFLGAGKTTLLAHLLQGMQGQRVAVIVNDFSQINIDARQLREGVFISRTEEQLIELSNGCICCSLRADLVKEVEQLANKGHFDYLLIEGSGISSPLTIAQTFSIDDHERQLFLSHFATLDTLVTVIDAYNFHDALFNASHETKDESIALLMEQIEFANVLIINKVEMLFENQLQQVQSLVQLANPKAKVLTTSFGQISPHEICHTGLFEGAQARKSADWLLAHERHRHLGLHGLRSFTFFDRRPFHPERLWAFLHETWPKGILRSKGLFWLASRPDQAMRWNQAGSLKSFSEERPWWGSMPESERVKYEEYLFSKPFLLERWDATYRDRMNELVFIGAGMNEAQIRADLDACICSEEEISHIKKGYSFLDAFPKMEETRKEGAFQYLRQFFRLT